MENIEDKMLKAIELVDWIGSGRTVVDLYAEACARVAEEEIAKVIEEAADVAFYGRSESNDVYIATKKIHESILQLKDKYLKSLNQPTPQED